MLDADTINILSKNFVTFLLSCFIFTKIINFKKYLLNKVVLVFVLCLGLTLMDFFIGLYIPKFFTRLALCLLSGVFMAVLTKNKMDISIAAIIMSMGMSITAFTITVIPASFMNHFIFQLDENSIIILFFIIIFQIALIYSFFKIKRFQDGFPFLQYKYTGVIGIFFSGIVLSIQILTSEYRSDLFVLLLTIGMVICGIGVVIWVRKSITMVYRKHLKDQAILQLEEESREKDKIIEKLSKENELYLKAEHKFMNRCTSLEMYVKNMAAGQLAAASLDVEFASRQAEIIDRINALSDDYQNEVANRIPKENTLSPTKIIGIDALFEYFLHETIQDEIDFRVIVNCSVNHMIQTVIPQGKLETLIGDHIKDAIIAVNASSSVQKRILVVFDLTGDYYQVCFHDSGIEFEPEVLLSLGVRQITTHADEGGSGIGFMTTFETMGECGASLVITEKEPSQTDFTKSVFIVFDNQNEYRIRSYRAEIIRSACEENGRIIIEDLK